MWRSSARAGSAARPSSILRRRDRNHARAARRLRVPCPSLWQGRGPRRPQARPRPLGWNLALMNRPEITLILARADTGVIGAGGTMAWHLTADLRRFKQPTMRSAELRVGPERVIP